MAESMAYRDKNGKKKSILDKPLYIPFSITFLYLYIYIYFYSTVIFRKIQKFKTHKEIHTCKKQGRKKNTPEVKREGGI